MEPMKARFVAMAQNANWTDVSVSYRFSSLDDAEIKDEAIPFGLTIIKYLFFLLIFLGIAGTVIELSHLGDIPDLDYKRLGPVQRFKTIRQYEPILIQRKKPWA